MKNIFFALALISATSLVQAEVSVETIKAGAVCVVENEDTKAGCPICPVQEENKCGICGKPKPKNHEADVDVDGQEEGDEVKCGCGKPKPGRTAGE